MYTDGVSHLINAESEALGMGVLFSLNYLGILHFKPVGNAQQIDI